MLLLTVIAPKTKTIEADINKSSFNKSLNNKFPYVGKFKTTDTIILPDFKNAST